MARITAGMNTGQDMADYAMAAGGRYSEISASDVQAARDAGFKADQIFFQLNGGKWYGGNQTVQNVKNALRPPSTSTPVAPSASTLPATTGAAPIAGLQAAAPTAAAPPVDKDQRPITQYAENAASSSTVAPLTPIMGTKRKPMQGLQSAMPSYSSAAPYYHGGNGLIY